MKTEIHTVRSGFAGNQCLVHARCAAMPGKMVATAQYLDIRGSDYFSGILASVSRDGGATWSEFSPQEGLAPMEIPTGTLVCCDGTPLYHQKTGKILLLGQTADYAPGAMHPGWGERRTFYSVFDPETETFGPAKFVGFPPPCTGNAGNGCGQSVELENGELLIPVYSRNREDRYESTVMRCAFDGENVTFLEAGTPLTLPMNRGLYEPSVICHKGAFYLTMRNDEAGFVARSTDGLYYEQLQHWMWEDGSLLQSYNTQQHWMVLGEELYLVYTRRNGSNDRVFRHRAPLYAARVEDLRLIRESEAALTPERGARLGNFGVCQLSASRAAVMAAEWMQPAGCERYGSDNSIFLVFIETE